MGEYYGVRMKDDPDGKYLQHWGISKGAMREGHKYLARLVTPSGYRYIYNQAQLAAAKAGRAVSGAANAVGNAIGLNQRNRAQQATARAQRISGGNKGREQSVQGIKRARMAKATAKRAQSAYDKTLLGRAEKAFNSARKGVSDAASGAQKAANDAFKTASRNVNRAVRRVDNNLGITAQGKRSKQAAEYKQKMLDRRYKEGNGIASNYGRRTFAPIAATEGGQRGHGNRNPATNRLKSSLNEDRKRRRLIAKQKEQEAAWRKEGRDARKERVQQERLASVRGSKRVDPFWSNLADIKSNAQEKVAARKKRKPSTADIARRHGVDSALNLMRTGQGLDSYNITKRGAAYRKKKRR